MINVENNHPIINRQEVYLRINNEKSVEKKTQGQLNVKFKSGLTRTMKEVSVKSKKN